METICKRCKAIGKSIHVTSKGRLGEWIIPKGWVMKFSTLKNGGTLGEEHCGKCAKD